MKHLNVFFVTLALTCLALFPATVRADDDLEDLDVTMVVLDDDTDLEDVIAEMRGPEVEDSNDGAGHDGDHEGDESDDVIEDGGDVEDDVDDRHWEDEPEHDGESDDRFASDHGFEEEDDLDEEGDFEHDEYVEDDVIEDDHPADDMDGMDGMDGEDQAGFDEGGEDSVNDGESGNESGVGID